VGDKFVCWSHIVAAYTTPPHTAGVVSVWVCVWLIYPAAHSVGFKDCHHRLYSFLHGSHSPPALNTPLVSLKPTTGIIYGGSMKHPSALCAKSVTPGRVWRGVGIYTEGKFKEAVGELYLFIFLYFLG